MIKRKDGEVKVERKHQESMGTALDDHFKGRNSGPDFIFLYNVRYEILPSYGNLGQNQ